MSQLNAKPPLSAGASAERRESGDILSVNSTPNKPPSQSPLFDRAIFWLPLASVLPVQPNVKTLVKSYGPYLRKIADAGLAAHWFLERGCNLAVVTGERGLLCLDFDDPSEYRRFAARAGILAETLTEGTPRGGSHVLYFCDDPLPTAKLRCCELKGEHGFVVSWPSCVGGRPYRIVKDVPILHIASCQLRVILPDLSLPSQRSDSPAAPTGNKTLGARSGLIGRILGGFDLLAYAQSLTRLVSRDSVWWRGRCPLHDDGRPSFWVNVQLGRWACFACHPKSDDAIGLYAAVNSLTLRDAVNEMAAKLPGR